MQIFLTVLVLILMLGILVSAHEAGHLVMAKLFNVYCLEYSIGFGPKLFSWKKKTAETRFSIRALPLGGYVSMYGEGVELPDGVSVPPERSLNGVAGWKRAFILSAGIVVNLFLSMLFVVIYATCIKTYWTTEKVYTGLDADGTSLADPTAHGEVAYSFWARGQAGDYSISDQERIYSSYGFTYNQNTYFVIDPEATITNGGVSSSYVACFKLTSVNDTDVLNNLTFFAPREAFYPTALNQAMGLKQYPDVSQTPHAPAIGDTLSLKVSVIGLDATENRPLRAQFLARQDHVVNATASSVNSQVQFSNNLLTIYAYQYYPSFGEAMSNACSDYANYVTGIGEGFKAIFSFNFSNVGSVVAVGGEISSASSQIGWARTFFFMGGYLSLNLAIFNLLPFPGLDGWQLLVTILEDGFKKKVSEKVKNTVSIVGLGLLFVFAIAITIKDIVALV
jgi:membrane-associated protease RseP (regulator of RpoE activity)